MNTVNSCINDAISRTALPSVSDISVIPGSQQSSVSNSDEDMPDTLVKYLKQNE